MLARLRMNRARCRLLAYVLLRQTVPIALIIVAVHGCISVKLEGLTDAVDAAMQRSVLRHKADIIGSIKKGVDQFAVAQIQQMNKAEEEYSGDVLFDAFQGENPFNLGWLYRSMRQYHSYDLVDVRDTGSLIKPPYEVTVRYNYEEWETKRRNSGDPTSMGKVGEDTDFHQTGEQGHLKFLYEFNSDLEWNGVPGMRLEEPQIPSSTIRLEPAVPAPAPAPAAAPPAVPPATPQPSDQLEDLPVPITSLGGEPPPQQLIDGLRNSPLLKRTKRKDSNSD